MAQGTKADPHIVAPDNWEDDGVDYGAWCRCSKCGLVGRSTFIFDFYADSQGDPLVGECCLLGATEQTSKVMNVIAAAGKEESPQTANNNARQSAS